MFNHKLSLNFKSRTNGEKELWNIFAKTDLFFSGHDNNNNNNEMATNCFRRGLSTMENEFTNFNVMAIFFLLHYIKL